MYGLKTKEVKTVILVPYQDTLDWKVKKMVEESDLKAKIIYFPSSELKDVIDTVDSKIKITMDKEKPDFLVVFSINSVVEPGDLVNMLNFLIEDDKAHSIGVWGDYFGKKNNIIQETEHNIITQAGRPGIYRGDIYRKYIKQACKDAMLRCNSESELLSHIGHLAKIDGFHTIIYSKYLMNGHKTQKDSADLQDYCYLCNAHNTVLNEICRKP